MNENLYLADILAPPVIYAANYNNISLIAQVASSFTAGNYCVIDLYLVSQKLINTNTILILNLSQSLSLKPNASIGISLLDNQTSFDPLATKINIIYLSDTVVIKLTNLPSIPINQVFIIHLDAIILPRSVGTESYLNVSNYNASSYFDQDLRRKDVIKIEVQTNLPDKMEIHEIKVGNQQANSLIAITFNISLPSYFLAWSDYLEFLIPPEVTWDPSQSALLPNNITTGATPTVPYYITFNANNRTVLATLGSNIPQKKQSFEITLLISSNNSFSTIGAFGLTFRDNLTRIIAQSPFIYPINWDPPAPFQNVLFSLSNPITSNLTDCVIQVDLSFQVPIGGTLILGFPPQLDYSSSLCKGSLSKNDNVNKSQDLACMNLKNGSFVITDSNGSLPITASTGILISVLNATTPSVSGPTILQLTFETRGTDGLYSLQKGEQSYNVTFLDEELQKSTVIGTTFHWLPFLTIYCLIVTFLALAHRVFLKKYNILPMVISLWSIADFPTLIYTLYHYYGMLGKDFQQSAIVIVANVMILGVGIITHVQELIKCWKRLGCAPFSKSKTKTNWTSLTLIIISIANSKLLWILFKENILETCKKRPQLTCSFLLLTGPQHQFGLKVSIFWTLICGVFEFSRGVLDLINQYQGYPFLFEAATFYLLSSILTAIFYCNIYTGISLGQEKRHQDQLPPTFNVLEAKVDGAVGKGIASQLSDSRINLKDQSLISVSATGGSSTSKDEQCSQPDKVIICQEEVKIQLEQEKSIDNNTNQPIKEKGIKEKLRFSSTTNQREVGSPYQELIKNLETIKERLHKKIFVS